MCVLTMLLQYGIFFFPSFFLEKFTNIGLIPRHVPLPPLIPTPHLQTSIFYYADKMLYNIETNKMVSSDLLPLLTVNGCRLCLSLVVLWYCPMIFSLSAEKVYAYFSFSRATADERCINEYTKGITNFLKHIVVMACNVVLGFVLIALPMTYYYAIQDSPGYGPGYAILAFGTSFMGDTAGYFIGGRFGSHKVFGPISPSKTLEGVLGNYAVTIATAVAMATAHHSTLSPFHIVAEANKNSHTHSPSPARPHSHTPLPPRQDVANTARSVCARCRCDWGPSLFCRAVWRYDGEFV